MPSMSQGTTWGKLAKGQCSLDFRVKSWSIGNRAPHWALSPSSRILARGKWPRVTWPTQKSRAPQKTWVSSPVAEERRVWEWQLIFKVPLVKVIPNRKLFKTFAKTDLKTSFCLVYFLNQGLSTEVWPWTYSVDHTGLELKEFFLPLLPDHWH